MYLLYDLILLLSAAFLVPYYLLRGLRYGKSRRGIRERLGFFAEGRLQPLMGGRVIWVHAVSVGETRAAIPLLKGLRSEYPEAKILVTNVTETGHSIAEKLPEVDLCLFFPFDFSWIVKHVLTQVSPELIVIVETEIWPNFVREARARNIPVVLVNGRLSDRSFPRYRLAAPLLKPILHAFSAFCMQSETDAQRIRILGAGDDQVVNSGNMKFDLKVQDSNGEKVKELKKEFGLSPEAQVFAAGSTHSGEEEQILEAFKDLADEHQTAQLILVPRHPERCRAVADLLKANGINFRFRSQAQSDQPLLKAGEVLLVDTLGEMINIYRMADAVFVGGSLVPIGGHNLLEASLVGKPVLFGPHVNNFKEISRMLLEAGGGWQVEDAFDLKRRLLQLLKNRDLAARMGEAGKGLIKKNQGATSRTLKIISQCLFSDHG